MTAGRGRSHAATDPVEVAAPRGRVEVSQLRWRPFGRRTPVIPGVDLDIPAGQRVLLVGPSGSGKSTLLRALAGVLEVADSGERSGTVRLDGAEPGSRAGAVGLVLQEPGAGIVSATVGRDVAFGLENIGVARADMPARVAAALAAVRLDMPQDTPTHALSGGEQQRLALAGALALGPSLLLLDEPTAMLDPDSAASVRASVAEVADAQRLTTVVVEHKLGPWLDFADRLVVLDDSGAVAADGDPHEVLARHGASLAAEGIWVPGVVAPAPLELPVGTFDTSPIGANVVGLSAEDVTVRRSVRRLDGSTRTTTAVRAQALAVRAGQVQALVGPSGSGKSSMVLAMAGLLEHAGSVAVHPDLVPDGSGRAGGSGGAGGPGGPGRSGRAAGADPAGWSTTDLARVLAWVPQWASSTLVAHTVLDEVMTTSRALALVETEALTRARTLLDVVGLAHLEQVDPRHLSGGEQRRLAVVSAVVHQPAVLLADEPTVGQDRLTWAAVTGVITALRDAGSAVVLTTHDEVVVALADRTTAMTRPEQSPPAPAPRRPLVARCGPLSLLAAAVLAIPAGVLSPHWTTSLVVLGIQVLLAVVALWAPSRDADTAAPGPTGRAKAVLLRMLPGLVGGLSVAWSTWLLGGHDPSTAFTAGLRVLIIVLPSAVLVRYVDADALGDHLAQQLHLPARPVVALAAALQRVHTFGDLWTEIARARRVRGIGATARSPRSVLAELWALTIGILVRSLQAAATLAVAMDARGFATAYRRTWAAPAPWRGADRLVVVASVLPVLVAAAGR